MNRRLGGQKLQAWDVRTLLHCRGFSAAPRERSQSIGPPVGSGQEHTTQIISYNIFSPLHHSACEVMLQSIGNPIQVVQVTEKV